MDEPRSPGASASGNTSAIPALLLPFTALQPTHRINRSLITLPHLTPRPQALFTPRRAIDTLAHPYSLPPSTTAEPAQAAQPPPAADASPDGSGLSVPAVAAVSEEASAARSHTSLSAPSSHDTARTGASVAEANGDHPAQPTLARASSISASTASVVSYIRTLAARLSASVSPRPISPDTPDSQPLSPTSAAQQQPNVLQAQQYVYDISPSSTARPSISPSTRSTSHATLPHTTQPPTHRHSTTQQALHQRVFTALDYDGNGFIGRQDLLRAIRVVRGWPLGSDGSDRGGGGRSDEALVECMLAMASVDDEDDEMDAPSGQLSSVEFQRMINKHWLTAVVSQ